jgi:hypothetical protein
VTIVEVTMRQRPESQETELMSVYLGNDDIEITPSAGGEVVVSDNGQRAGHEPTRPEWTCVDCRQPFHASRAGYG